MESGLRGAVALGKSARALLMGEVDSVSPASAGASSRLRVVGALAIASTRMRTGSDSQRAENKHADAIVDMLRAALQRSSPPLYRHTDVLTGKQDGVSRCILIILLLSIPVHMTFDVIAALGIWGVQADGSVEATKIAPLLVCLYPLNILQFTMLLLSVARWDDVWAMTRAVVGEGPATLASFEAGGGDTRRGISLPKLRWLATQEHASLIRRASNTVTAQAWRPALALVFAFTPPYMLYIAVPGITAFSKHYGLDPNGAATWAMILGSCAAVVLFNLCTGIGLGPQILTGAIGVEAARDFVGKLDAVVLPKLRAEVAANGARKAGGGGAGAPRPASIDDDSEGEGEGAVDGAGDGDGGGHMAFYGDGAGATDGAVDGDAGSDAGPVKASSTRHGANANAASAGGSDGRDLADLRALYAKYVQLRRVAATTRSTSAAMVLAPVVHASTIVAGIFAMVAVSPRYNPFVVLLVAFLFLALPADFATPVMYNNTVRRGRRRLAELRLMAGSLNAPVLGASLDRFARILGDDAEAGGGFLRIFGFAVSNAMVASMCSGTATVTWLLLQPQVTVSLT